MFVVFLLFAAFVIVPFVIWGERMDANAPEFVQGQATKWAVALAGIGLLVLDVVLPVPSSVVSISLCFLLGPAWGATAVFVGMVGAFVVGFLLGRLLPTTRLRTWVDAQTWDAVSSKHRTGGLWWIAASRPVPVLAEVAAVFAGSLGMPFAPSLAAASLSSLLVSVAYGIAGWLGLQQAGASMSLLVLSAACLPVASWTAYQWWRR
jgi:uncharacterized membrane protein YdjX (TVP38/TMEM64 family)